MLLLGVIVVLVKKCTAKPLRQRVEPNRQRVDPNGKVISSIKPNRQRVDPNGKVISSIKSVEMVRAEPRRLIPARIAPPLEMWKSAGSKWAPVPSTKAVEIVRVEPKRKRFNPKGKLASSTKSVESV